MFHAYHLHRTVPEIAEAVYFFMTSSAVLHLGQGFFTLGVWENIRVEIPPTVRYRAIKGMLPSQATGKG